MQSQAKPKILLVDDKPENIEALIRILEDFDIEMITAANGNRALEQTLRHEFALILLDVQMPGMDGYETATLIRSRSDAPIIFVTAFGKEKQGYESGAVDYMVKPLDPHILRSKVSVFLTLFNQKQQLVDSNQRLEAQDRQIKKLKTLATLTGGVAHEFNNLLVPIIGFTKMVRDGQSSESTEAGYLDRVIKASYRAKEIVSQVRLFSQKREIRLDPVRLQPVLEETFDELHKNLPESIRLITEVDIDVPAVMGSVASMKQLLQNLYKNALDAMPEGGELRVRLCSCEESPLPRLEEAEADISCIRLVVEDTGHGMAPEIQDQMFDPFFSTHKHGTHTGLGLSVVLGIVEQLDGEIDVSSDPDSGTRVSICLMVAAGYESRNSDELGIENQFQKPFATKALIDTVHKTLNREVPI
jgi:two-component system, sensor histidine kinase and response regulator